METIKHVLDVPKEFKEVVDPIVKVIKKIKSGAPKNEYFELFNDMVVGVKGADKIPEEMRSQYRDDAAGYLTQQMMEAIVPYKEPL